MVNNIVQVTVATTSSLKADLFNMADKHADIRRSVWTTPSVSDKFQFEGDTLNVTQKKVIFDIEKQRCFTHGGDHVSVGFGSASDCVACVYTKQNVVCIEMNDKQFRGGLARFKQDTGLMVSKPEYALATWKAMYAFLQVRDLPLRAIATRSPSAASAPDVVVAQRAVSVRSSVVVLCLPSPCAGSQPPVEARGSGVRFGHGAVDAVFRAAWFIFLNSVPCGTPFDLFWSGRECDVQPSRLQACFFAHPAWHAWAFRITVF